MKTTTEQTTPVRIWDLPTRVFHWSLVAGMAFMWGSAELGGLWMDWHMQVGQFMLALILFRIIWGFVGSETARFSFFIRSPLKAIQHLQGELRSPVTEPAYHAGHNPAGAWMVLALLMGLLVQAGSGLFVTDDIMVEGPLYGLVSDYVSGKLTSVHHLLFNILLLFVVIHVFAIIFYKIRKRTNLLKAMVQGEADWPDAMPAPKPLKFVSPWWGLLVFLGCYAGVYFGLKWLAG